MTDVAATPSLAFFPIINPVKKKKDRESDRNHIFLWIKCDRRFGYRRIAAENGGRGCLTELIDMIIHTIS